MNWVEGREEGRRFSRLKVRRIPYSVNDFSTTYRDSSANAIAQVRTSLLLVCCFNHCPKCERICCWFLVSTDFLSQKAAYTLYLIVGFRGLSAYKHKHIFRCRSVNHKIASEMLERPQTRDAVRRDIIAGNQDQGARGVAVQFPGLDR